MKRERCVFDLNYAFHAEPEGGINTPEEFSRELLRWAYREGRELRIEVHSMRSWWMASGTAADWQSLPSIPWELFLRRGRVFRASATRLEPSWAISGFIFIPMKKNKGQNFRPAGPSRGLTGRKFCPEAGNQGEGMLESAEKTKFCQIRK